MKRVRYSSSGIYNEYVKLTSCVLVNATVLGLFKADIFVIFPHLCLMYFPVTHARLKIIQIEVFFLQVFNPPARHLQQRKQIGIIAVGTKPFSILVLEVLLFYLSKLTCFVWTQVCHYHCSLPVLIFLNRIFRVMPRPSLCKIFFSMIYLETIRVNDVDLFELIDCVEDL